MFCLNCRNRVGENDKFCDNCGIELKKENVYSLTADNQAWKRYRRNTKVMIGAIIAAGAILLVTLLALAFVYHDKAQASLDELSKRYEQPYMREHDGGKHFF